MEEEPECMLRLCLAIRLHSGQQGWGGGLKGDLASFLPIKTKELNLASIIAPHVVESSRKCNKHKPLKPLNATRAFTEAPRRKRSRDDDDGDGAPIGIVVATATTLAFVLAATLAAITVCALAVRSLLCAECTCT